MSVEFLFNIFEAHREKEAVIWNDESYSYGWLSDRIGAHRIWLEAENVQSGEVILISGDFSPNSIAMLLALLAKKNIIVPVVSRIPAQRTEELGQIALAKHYLAIDSQDNLKLRTLPCSASHNLYDKLREANEAGLVLFTSGSTGQSKAAVHNTARLLEKYQRRRYSLRSLAFLIFDHIGGIDTALYSLSNVSCLVTCGEKSVDAVCRTVEKHKVEVLPASPSFLNLLILSRSYLNYDLSSLKFITYGAEVMPESTLRKCAELFPAVTILQKYGTTEVGTLRSKSKSSDSLWVRLGGEGYQTRVIEGILHIKARSAMMGYLNAESPFTEDGWFVTGDCVSVEGDYYKILGRKSDVINVGGEKVYPAEVECVIQELDDISEVTVYGQENSILGNIVCAKVRPRAESDRDQLKGTIVKHCRERLARYKVPAKIVITDSDQHTARFKKDRAETSWQK